MDQEQRRRDATRFIGWTLVLGGVGTALFFAILSAATDDKALSVAYGAQSTASFAFAGVVMIVTLLSYLNLEPACGEDTEEEPPDAV